MNRGEGLLARLEPAPAPLIVGGVLGGVSLTLLAVLKLGLPIWSLLLLVGVVAYVITVLQRPTVGLLAVVCLFFLPTQVPGNVTLLQLVGVGTSALLLIWFLYQQRGMFWGNVLLPFFVLGILILVSFLFTRDASRTLMLFRKWVFNMFFALLLLNFVTRFDVLRKVIWAMIIMISINAAVGIVDFAALSDTFYRSKGLLGNANHFGHLSALAFPLALYQYLYRKGIVRWIGLALCGLLAGGVIVSVSRGAVLSLVLVFLVVLVVERRRIVPLALVIALGLCATPFLPDYFHRRVGNLVTDVKRSVFVHQEKVLTSRGYLNKAGIKIWQDHPVLGVGVGNFGFYYVEKDYNPGMLKSDRVVAHSIYMQALAETGTVGGLTLLWLILVSLRNIILARRASRHDPDRWLYFGAIEMMALAVFISMASYGSLLNSDFWLFVCLPAVSKRVAESEQIAVRTQEEPA